MTIELQDISQDLAQRILLELPLAVAIVDLTGKVIVCNPRAYRIYSPHVGVPVLTVIEEWQPRSGTLTKALQSVAGSSSWIPVALRRGNERIELKGRGLMLDGYAEPRVLLMETHVAPLRFAEHSEQVRRLNTQLSIQDKTEGKLRAALRTAEELRRELVHRVKNNLAIVSVLLRTKARAAEHPEAAEALMAAAARVNSIAIVHDILDARNETEVVTTKALLTALLDHLRDAICPPHIILECEVYDTELHTETAIPLCLLVNELVTNAIKHAFNGRNGGEVRVVFKETKDSYQLVVADNGSGISEKPARIGTGSRIIEALAQQLRSEITVSRSGGTTWSISLHPSIKGVALTPFHQPSDGQRIGYERTVEMDSAQGETTTQGSSTSFVNPDSPSLASKRS